MYLTEVWKSHTKIAQKSVLKRLNVEYSKPAPTETYMYVYALDKLDDSETTAVVSRVSFLISFSQF